MPTDDEIRLYRVRQAYWLWLARETDPRKPTLAEVAVAAGLQAGSGSVVSLWENDWTKEGPKRSQLLRLAGYYGLPLGLFDEPPPTDREKLERLRGASDPGILEYYRGLLADRDAGAAHAAIALEREDSGQEDPPSPAPDDASGEPRRIRPA